MSDIGCFGKVPAHGDFVWQGLPARFVTPWDNWLQEQLLRLREQRPDDWLDVYLCGHMWRFLIRDDALGSETWAGIILPSVDVVGRYFPFTLAASLPRYAPLVSSVRLLSPWLAQAEEIALEALSETLSAEDVLTRVRAVPLPETGELVPDEAPGEGNIWCGRASGEDYWADQLLNELIGHSFSQPCHWSNIDAETGATTYFLSEGFGGFDLLFSG